MSAYRLKYIFNDDKITNNIIKFKITILFIHLNWNLLHSRLNYHLYLIDFLKKKKLSKNINYLLNLHFEEL